MRRVGGCGVWGAALAVVLAACVCQIADAGACSELGDCNGHGTCDATTTQCACYDGWGSASDVTSYKSPDCSKRVCPSGAAWVDAATATNTAHAPAECSNAGLCDRSSGKCRCFDGYDGEACQRTACPNDCSGHGKCVSISQMASENNAKPVDIESPSFTYGGSESVSTWDEDKIFGCVCDSSWTVSLASGDTQEPEWFGPDCSLRHCASGDDPMTTADETDCNGKVYNGQTAAGRGAVAGNLCHVDCANRGICDYSTGLCDCFDGFYGVACTLQSELATGSKS